MGGFRDEPKFKVLKDRSSKIGAGRMRTSQKMNLGFFWVIAKGALGREALLSLYHCFSNGCVATDPFGYESIDGKV